MATNNPLKVITLTLVCIGLAACGGGSSDDDDDRIDPGDTDTLSLMPAVADAPYADVLADCATPQSESDACDLSTLPFLSQEVAEPTIDDIMGRVVVTNTWMGKRFRELLEELPEDMHRLFGAVTVVLIGGEIRPSFYTSRTGGIYLDPANLWLTNGEKSTVSQQNDFRAFFGAELAFVPLARYLDDGEYAWQFYSLDGTEERALEDIVLPMAALLLHELAHANDLLPVEQRDNLNPEQTTLEAIIGVVGDNASETLDNAIPLTSDIWRQLADVLYEGSPANLSLRQLSGTEAGLLFEVDGASDDYGYTNIYEDTAMIFEEVMMKYYFDVDRELAFTDQPADGEERFCDAYIIRWGMRNRSGDTLVSSRAEIALQEVLNESDVSQYLAVLETPQRLAGGEDWCTVQNLTAPLALQPQALGNEQRATIRPDSFRRIH